MAKFCMLMLALSWVMPGIAGTWQIDTVDAGAVGRFSSLKVDKDGNVHLAYVLDEKQFPLKYAFWDHKLKRWFTMKVAEFASFCSLTLDSNQRPHISWADAGSSSGAKLRYGHWDGNAWKTLGIPLDSDVIAYYTSIGLDAEDHPSISFYEYRGARGTDISVRLRVVTNRGTHWEVVTADGQNQSGKFNALAVDKRGRIHVGYANVGAMTGGTRYGLFSGESWRLEVLEGLVENKGMYVGGSINLALDKDDVPHLSYMNSSNGVVKYAVRSGDRWRIEQVDRVARVAYPDRNGIAVDETGVPYMSYFDAGRGQLRLAYRKGAKWFTEIIDANGSGVTSSVAVDKGSIWISYGDDLTGSLKVARSVVDPGAPEMSGGVAQKAPDPEKRQ